MDLKDIAKRVKKGEPVTPQEYAFLIRNDREAFFAFLIANNPASMNDILRHRLQYTSELGFRPDVQKIQRIVQMILDRDNKSEIATIVQNFQVNKSGISQQLWNEIKAQFN